MFIILDSENLEDSDENEELEDEYDSDKDNISDLEDSNSKLSNYSKLELQFF
jgi:predicted nuclease with TOPRIM domain